VEDFIVEWVARTMTVLLWILAVIVSLVFLFLIITWAFVSYDTWAQEWVGGNLWALLNLLWMVPVVVGLFLGATRLTESVFY
jgi:hypothetical protein